MVEATRLEKAADGFIENYLRDHPIMVYELDNELKEYAEDVPELNDKIRLNEIMLEYMNSEKGKDIQEDVNSELINAEERVSNPSENYRNIETPDTALLAHIQYVAQADSVIGELMQLVTRSNKVRIREMKELKQAEQDDVYSPNKWIYHKDWNLSEVLNYIRNEYDQYRKIDEEEEENKGI